MSASARTHFLIDFGIAALFLVLSNPPTTGPALHEWLGLALTAALVAHLLLHWSWVVRTTCAFFGAVSSRARIHYVVTVALFIGFTAATLSGLLISTSVGPVVGLDGAAAPGWRGLHELAADLTLVAVAIHVAMHWQWVLGRVRHDLRAPTARWRGRMPGAAAPAIGACRHASAPRFRAGAQRLAVATLAVLVLAGITAGGLYVAGDAFARAQPERHHAAPLPGSEPRGQRDHGHSRFSPGRGIAGVALTAGQGALVGAAVLLVGQRASRRRRRAVAATA